MDIREAKETLSYRCPHCDAPVEVERQLVGQIVKCTSCDSPFRAEVPSAEPLDPEPGGAEQDHAAIATPGDDERVLHRIHPAMFRNQPLVYLIALTFLAAGVAGLIVSVAARSGIELASGTAGLWNLPQPTLQWVSLGLTASGGLYLFAWWVRTRFVTLTVTTERSVFKRGLISRQTSEVRHRDVRNLQVEQGVVQRLLGVGSIAISSSGQDDLEIFAAGIPRPDRVADTVRTHQSSGRA